MSIPVSVIVTTLNEENRIADCLTALRDFDELIVVDSQSRDLTQDIARDCGAGVYNFAWNKAYPKKRQWCLDTISLKYDWIFFVDADEVVTAELIDEIKNLFLSEPSMAGYFVTGRYLMDGAILKHGLANRKLALLNRKYMEFPVIDDLDIPGMGEMEGHYQPVLKPSFENQGIGSLKACMIHDAVDDERAWVFRHQKYARWETGMNQKNAWPDDPKPCRNFVKKFLRNTKFRPQLIFLISYIGLAGFLDGARGLKFARMKKNYYAQISH